MTINVKCVLCGQIFECEPTDTKNLVDHLRKDHPELNLSALFPSTTPPVVAPVVPPPVYNSDGSSEEFIAETEKRAECRRKKLDSINEEVKYEKLLKEEHNGTKCEDSDCDEPEIRTWGPTKRENSKKSGLYVQINKCTQEEEEYIPPSPPKTPEFDPDCPTEKQTQLRYHPSLLTNNFFVDNCGIKSTEDPDNEESCFTQTIDTCPKNESSTSNQSYQHKNDDKQSECSQIERYFHTSEIDKKEVHKKTKPTKHESSTDQLSSTGSSSTLSKSGVYETTKSRSKSLGLREMQDSIDEGLHSTKKNRSCEDNSSKTINLHSAIKTESLTELQKILQQEISTELKTISKEKDILTSLKDIRKQLTKKLDQKSSTKPVTGHSGIEKGDYKKHDNNEDKKEFLEDKRIEKLHGESIDRLEKAEQRITEITNELLKLSKMQNVSPEPDLKKSKRNTGRSLSSVQQHSPTRERLEGLENEKSVGSSLELRLALAQKRLSGNMEDKSYEEVKSKTKHSSEKKSLFDRELDKLEEEIEEEIHEEKYLREHKHHNLSSESEPPDEQGQVMHEAVDQLEAQHRSKSKSENKLEKIKHETTDVIDEEKHLKEKKHHSSTSETEQICEPDQVRDDTRPRRKSTLDNKLGKIKHETTEEKSHEKKYLRENKHQSLSSESEPISEPEPVRHENFEHQARSKSESENKLGKVKHKTTEQESDEEKYLKKNKHHSLSSEIKPRKAGQFCDENHKNKFEAQPRSKSALENNMGKIKHETMEQESDEEKYLKEQKHHSLSSEIKPKKAGQFCDENHKHKFEPRPRSKSALENNLGKIKHETMEQESDEEKYLKEQKHHSLSSEIKPKKAGQFCDENHKHKFEPRPRSKSALENNLGKIKHETMEQESDEEKYLKEQKHHSLSSEIKPKKAGQFCDENHKHKFEARPKSKSALDNNLGKIKHETMEQESDEEKHLKEQKHHSLSSEMKPKKAGQFCDEKHKHKLEARRRSKSTSENNLGKIKHETMEPESDEEKYLKEQKHHSLSSEIKPKKAGQFCDENHKHKFEAPPRSKSSLEHNLGKIKHETTKENIDEEKYLKEKKHHSLSSETKPKKAGQFCDETGNIETRRRSKSTSENKLGKIKHETTTEHIDEQKYLRSNKHRSLSSESCEAEQVRNETIKHKFEPRPRSQSKLENKLGKLKHETMEEEHRREERSEKNRLDCGPIRGNAAIKSNSKLEQKLEEEESDIGEEKQIDDNKSSEGSENSCQEKDQDSKSELESEKEEHNIKNESSQEEKEDRKIVHNQILRRNSSKKSGTSKSRLGRPLEESEIVGRQNLMKHDMTNRKNQRHAEPKLENESEDDIEQIEECSSSNSHEVLEHNPSRKSKIVSSKSRLRNESEEEENEIGNRKSGDRTLRKKSKSESGSGKLNLNRSRESKRRSTLEHDIKRADEEQVKCEEQIIHEQNVLKVMVSASNRFRMRAPSGCDSCKTETSKNYSQTIDLKIKNIETQLDALKLISEELHSMQKPIELEKFSMKNNSNSLENKLEQVEKLLSEGQRIVSEERFLLKELCGLEKDPIKADHKKCLKITDELKLIEQEFSRTESQLMSKTKSLQNNGKKNKSGEWKNKIDRVEGHLMDLKKIASIERNLLNESVSKKHRQDKTKLEGKRENSISTNKQTDVRDSKNMDTTDTCLSKKGIISNLPQLKESTNLYDAFSCNVCADDVIAEQEKFVLNDLSDYREEKDCRRSKQRNAETATEEGQRMASGREQLNEINRKTIEHSGTKKLKKFEDKTLYKMSKDNNLHDSDYLNYYKITSNYIEPQTRQHSSIETYNKNSDEITESTSFSNMTNNRYEENLTKEETFRKKQHMSSASNENQNNSLKTSSRNKKSIFAANEVENEDFNLNSNECTGKSVKSRILEFDNLNNNQRLNENKKETNQLLKKQNEYKGEESKKNKITNVDTLQKNKSTYLGEKLSKNQTNKRHRSSIVKETRSVSEINHPRTSRTSKRDFKRSSEPAINKLIEKKQIGKPLQTAGDKRTQKYSGKSSHKETESKRLKGGLQSRNKHERCTRREHKIDTSFETKDYVPSKSHDSLSDTSVTHEPINKEISMTTQEKSSAELAERKPFIDAIMKAIEKDLEKVDALEKQGDALLSQIKAEKLKASVSDSSLQARNKPSKQQKKISDEEVPTQKYIVKSSEPFIKSKYYRTTIQKSEKGKGFIFCPNCKCEAAPMIKSTCERVSSNGLGAACILTFWPCAYMSCSATNQTKSYLYCSKCNYFLGISEPPKNEKPIANEEQIK